MCAMFIRNRSVLFSVLPLLLVPAFASAAFVLVTTLGGPTPEELAASLSVEATVTQVIDGATIEVDLAGQTFQVRYVGVALPDPLITTPALSMPNPLYNKATSLNRDLVEGQIVRLERGETHLDADGRLLRWVWVGDRLISEALVRQGLAQVDVAAPDNAHEQLLFDALQRARVEGLGIWNVAETECVKCDGAKETEVDPYADY